MILAPEINQYSFLASGTMSVYNYVSFLNIVISNLTAPPPLDKVQTMTWNRSIFQDETKRVRRTAVVLKIIVY